MVCSKKYGYLNWPPAGCRMKGLWTWATEKVSSIKSGISYTFSVISSTYHTITSLPAVRNFAYSFGVKGWEGATRPFDPYNVTKMAGSPKSRSSLKASFAANVIYYLSFALLYEVTYQSIVSAFSDEDDSLAESSAYFTMSTFALVGLGGLMLHRYYDNTVINLALAKQVADENPTSHHYKPCGCDEGAIISAGLFSSLNLSGKLLSIWIASYLPVIRYLTPLAYAYAYGESLAEYPYSSVGVCTRHRAEELAKHNAYSLGIGASLYAVGELITYLIYRQTGVNSFFISNAVYAAIYPWFVTSVLLRDRPLPGDEQGVDFFYYHRYVLQHMADNIGKQIIPLLQNTKKTVDWRKYLQQAAEFAPVRWTKTALSYDLYGDWHTLDGFLASPANMIFFDEYYAMTRQQLNKIIDLRDKPVLKRPLKEMPMAIIAPIVPVIPDKITKFVMTDAYKRLIKIIFDAWLEDPLKSTRDGLEYVRKVQERTRIKVVTHDAKRLKELLADAIGTEISSPEKKSLMIADGHEEQKKEVKTNENKRNDSIRDEKSLQKESVVGCMLINEYDGSEKSLGVIPVRLNEDQRVSHPVSLASQSIFSGSIQGQEKLPAHESSGQRAAVTESSPVQGMEPVEKSARKKTLSDFIMDDYRGTGEEYRMKEKTLMKPALKKSELSHAFVDREALQKHNMHASIGAVQVKGTSESEKGSEMNLRQSH